MSKAWKEAGVCLAFIAVSAVIYKDSLKLPPGNYDPLGGGTMPRIVCIIIILLSLAVVVQTLVPALRSKIREEPSAEVLDYRLRPDLALMIFGLLILYTAAIQLAVPFAISTGVFLFLAMIVTGEFPKRLILPSLFLSAATAATLAYAFISVLKVDLP